MEHFFLMITYPDHLLTDSHELKVKFRVDHLSLLQSKDLLVTTLGQMLLVVLQTLNHLNTLKPSTLHRTNLRSYYTVTLYDQNV